jgi:hypothetical protein
MLAGGLLEDGFFQESEGVMSEWPAFVRHAFSAIHVLDLDEQEITRFAGRWGGLDLSTFVRALHEGEAKEQQIAAYAIGWFPSRWARDLLLPLLENANDAVRWTAALELGRMREEAAFPVLLRMAQEFLPPHTVPVEYDWYDIRHLSVARVLGSWGKQEAIPVLREALARMWQAERNRSANQDIQLWWHYQDALVAALGQLGDFEALKSLSDLPAGRSLLWAVTLVLGYLGYLTTASIVQNTIIELLTDASIQDDQTGRFALVSDVLQSRIGFSPEEAASFSASYQREYLNRWEQDAPPFGSQSEDR